MSKSRKHTLSSHRRDVEAWLESTSKKHPPTHKKYSTEQNSYAEGVRRNESKLCVACETNHRKHLSRYCMTCNQQYYLWGDPNGRAIPRSQYASELEKYERLVRELRGKKPVRMALGFLSQYLQKSLDGAILFNPDRYMTKLAESGLEAEEMLIESLAVYDYCIHHRKPSPKHQVGNSIIRLRWWSGKRSSQGKHRRIIGEYVLNNLGSFFDHMVVFESMEEKFKQEMNDALKQLHKDQSETEDE